MTHPERTTRRLTGRPSWPITLLAGVQKSGKSFRCVEASTAPYLGRTLYVNLGEDAPDEYGAVRGERTELVAHDGSYRDVLDALGWAATQPPHQGRPNLIVLDSGTRLYDLLVDMSHAVRMGREKGDRRRPDEGGKLTPDLWNLVADRWGHIVDVLRTHQGPSIITARLDLVSIFDEGGNITREKRWKVQAHKSATYDVGAIIELREAAPPGLPAPAVLHGVRSLRLRPDRLPDGTITGEVSYPQGLSFDALWRGLGLVDDDGAAVPVGARHHDPTRVADPDPDPEPVDRGGRHERPQQTRQQPAQQRATTGGGFSPHRAASAPQEPAQPPADLTEALAVAVGALAERDVAVLAETYRAPATAALLDVDVAAALDDVDRAELDVPPTLALIPLGKLLMEVARYAQRTGAAVRWERQAEAAREGDPPEREELPVGAA